MPNNSKGINPHDQSLGRPKVHDDKAEKLITRYFHHALEPLVAFPKLDGHTVEDYLAGLHVRRVGADSVQLSIFAHELRQIADARLHGHRAAWDFDKFIEKLPVLTTRTLEELGYTRSDLGNSFATYSRPSARSAKHVHSRPALKAPKKRAIQPLPNAGTLPKNALNHLRKVPAVGKTFTRFLSASGAASQVGILAAERAVRGLDVHAAERCKQLCRAEHERMQSDFVALVLALLRTASEHGSSDGELSEMFVLQLNASKQKRRSHVRNKTRAGTVESRSNKKQGKRAREEALQELIELLDDLALQNAALPLTEEVERLRREAGISQEELESLWVEALSEADSHLRPNPDLSRPVDSNQESSQNSEKRRAGGTPALRAANDFFRSNKNGRSAKGLDDDHSLSL